MRPTAGLNKPNVGALEAVGLFLLCLQVILITTARAQNSKGGGGGSSKFREQILSVQRVQQQQAPIVQVQQQHEHEEVQVQQQQLIEQPPSQVSIQQSSFESTSQQTVDSSSSESTYGSVKGTPGVDFPNYNAIPNTKFTCDGVPFDPGMYADESTGCQVYHICFQGRRESFLCGLGTVFNQAILGCDFWHAVECSQSSRYYNLNAEFGKSVPETQQSFSSVSKTSSSRSSSIVRPQPAFSIQQVNFERQVIVQQPVVQPPPIQQSFVRNVEYSSSVAPTKSSVSQFSSSGKTSARKSYDTQQQAFSSQRTILSPVASRRNSNNNNFQSISQFASESSPIRSQIKGVSSQQVSSGAISVKGAGGGSSLQSKSLQRVELGDFKSTSIKSASDEQQVWRPYVRSKSSKTTNSTTTTTTTTPTPPTSSTVAPAADKEPAFSSNSSPPAPETITTTTSTTTSAPPSDEVPAPPASEKSDPPPATTEAPASSSESPAAVTSTTSEAPTTESAVTTTTAAAAAPESSPAPAEVTTTTTTTAAPTTTGSEPAPEEEGASEESRGKKKKRKRKSSKKRKRGGESSSVKKKRLTASSVEYAARN